MRGGGGGGGVRTIFWVVRGLNFRCCDVYERVVIVMQAYWNFDLH